MADLVLCKMEIDVLRECAGELAPSPWGAAVGACLEVLRGNGLVTRQGLLTDKGTKYLKDWHRTRAMG